MPYIETPAEFGCPDCDGDGEGKTNSMDYSDIPLCRTCKGTGRFQPFSAPTENAEGHTP